MCCIEEGSSPEFWQLLREVKWACMSRPRFMLLLCFDIGIMFSNFHVYGMLLLFNAMLYM